MSTWGDRIKQKREELGMSYRELERLTGINHTTFMRYETGEIKDVRLERIMKIAPALQCNPLWLSGLIDEDLPYGNKKDKGE